MKILQLIPNISGGGAERFTVDLSNDLAKKHDVSFVTLYNPQGSDLFREDLNDKINTYAVGKKLGFDHKMFTRLYKVINRIQPDVIHSHLRSVNYLMPIYPLIRIPTIHTVHSDAFEDCPNDTIRYLRRLFFKQQLTVPVTISGESQQSFQKAYDGAESEMICNGRAYPPKTKEFTAVSKEIESLKKNKETEVFVHVGRIQKEKNQLMLVKAFNKLVYEYDANAVLIIIGGGRDAEESRQIQRQLQQAEQVHSHIHLLGERPNATDYLHAADYFCLSSLYEGMPITLIEAFATGCIPVCTPVGGISEMVEDLDKTLLAESVSESDYLKTLKKALNIPQDRRMKLKKQAVSLFEEKYSMEHCAEKYLKLYRSLSG